MNTDDTPTTGMCASSSPPPGSSNQQPATGAQALSAAAVALRQHTDAGWTRVRSGLLASAMAAFRPSAPVRGRHVGGDFFVASDVLVARVRLAVDGLRSAAAQKITVRTDDTHDLDELLVQIIAAYGAPLVDLASQVREAAVREVVAVLGIAAAADKVAVDIHIGDITLDPSRL